MKFSKADKLYLLLGGNPMPNIKVAGVRIKKDGEIICIYTTWTKKIFEKVKMIVDEKNNKLGLSIKVSGIYLENISDIEATRDELSTKVVFDDEKNKIIELNFTGSTSIVSTLAFEVFIEKVEEVSANKLILSYMDTEAQTINLMIKNREKVNEYTILDYANIEKTFDITGRDITLLHDDKIKLKKEFSEELIKFPKLVDMIYQEVLMSREHGVAFTDVLYYGTQGLKIKDKDEFFMELEKNIFNGQTWNFFKEVKDLFIDIEKFENVGKGKLEKVLKTMRGFWFEDYISKICLELKKEGLIQEVFSSVVRGAQKREDFEVDLVITTEDGLRSISVTTVADEKIGKYKLYEVKIRARQLGGDESKIAYINFCNKSELEKQYKNYWSDELKGDLIIGYDEINNMKNLLRNWILGEV